jgi:hypothetical protein
LQAYVSAAETWACNCNSLLKLSADCYYPTNQFNIHFFELRRKTIVAGLGASMIDTDNFEKNNTSIYVTNGVGSRFFSNFNTNAGLFCSKFENENKREFGAR